MSGRSPITGVRDWGHLPAVAVQSLGKHCCPASTAKLRVVCRNWHDALTRQFAELFIGPGSPWQDVQQQPQLAATAPAAGLSYDAIARSFPAAHTLHVTASSTRDYPPSYTEDLAQLLCNTPSLVSLSLEELHELEEFDNLDTASLWDALHAAAAVPGGIASRLLSLRVSDCFWNTPELFCVLKQLTGLTQLRLLNNPLETACEVNIIASLTQLKVLEFGLIFDGSSQHHDVPRALEQVSNLTCLQELSIPMWRRSLGGRAHPLAPSLAVVLGKLTGLTSLAVDGRFGYLSVVSCLTNLRRLASAAPLSMEGWQAVSQLPQLTLLTSLTPSAEPLRVNPARPHAGLDLGMLATRSCLNGLDVAVMQPEHLATLGQFTALQRLNLRCASTFQNSQQQAQLLTALSCLPSSLTNLTLGPLLPLSATLMTSIARSCPTLAALSARFTHVAASVIDNSGSGPGLVPDNQQMELDHPPGVLHSFFGTDAAVDMSEDLVSLAAVAEAGIECSSTSVSEALQQLQALTSLELVLLPEEEAGDEQPGYGTSGGGMSSSRPHSSAGNAVTTGAVAVTRSAASSWKSLQLALEDLPKGLKQLVLSGPWLLGTKSSERGARSPDAAVGHEQLTEQQQQPCAVCGLSTDMEPADSTSLKSLCHCINSLGVCRNSPAQQAASANDSPTKHVTLGHKRPGSYSSALAGAAAQVVFAAPDVFVLERQNWLDKRSRSFNHGINFSSNVAAGVTAPDKNRQQQRGSASPADSSEIHQQQPKQQALLPVLSKLCLYCCHTPYDVLVQLIECAGPHLQKLQLLQLHTNPLPPLTPTAAAVLSPRAAVAAAAARAARLSGSGGSSSMYRAHDPTLMTTVQLLQLPVVWSHLEEWHLQSCHLWGLVKAGCCRSTGSIFTNQQISKRTGGVLQHLSQLLNLRHLYVVNRPTAFTTAQPSSKDHNKGEAATVLPLHDKPAVESLLLQLQQGVQQLPALRQLLLYMGQLTKQQPELPDYCHEAWAEAGERLLECMPACRVRLYPPVVNCLSSYPLPDCSEYAMHGLFDAPGAAVTGVMLGIGQQAGSASSAVLGGGAFGHMAADEAQQGGSPFGRAGMVDAVADMQEEYVEDYVI